MDLRDEIKVRLRIKSTAFDEAEILPLIEACKGDLTRVGVTPDENNPLVRQAVALYCKANFGFADDTKEAERFQKAYEGLRDSMSLSGDFSGGGTT